MLFVEDLGIDEKKVKEALYNLKKCDMISYEHQRCQTIWIQNTSLNISYLEKKISGDRKYKLEQVSSMRKYIFSCEVSIFKIYEVPSS